MKSDVPMKGSETRMVLIGRQPFPHLGGHFSIAGKELGLRVELIDPEEAYTGPLWISRWNWWVRGRRPTRMKEFGQEVLQACQSFQPRLMLSIGIVPIEADTLVSIGKLGIQRINYLTDDPWNPTHRASWFVGALTKYDYIFSPRRANLEDLKRLGNPRVSFLPFAYAPQVHFPEPCDRQEERDCFGCDLLFVGGADRDRIPRIRTLIRSEFKICLFGNYWDRFPDTRPYWRGHADASTLRQAIGRAKVVLCLVRRANRDGASMRSFEVPAMGGCMLTEDTVEHRELFGEEGKAVLYFRTVKEMVEKLRQLLDDAPLRQRFSEAAHRLITQGKHTYRDRLTSMLRLTDGARDDR